MRSTSKIDCVYLKKSQCHSSSVKLYCVFFKRFCVTCNIRNHNRFQFSINSKCFSYGSMVQLLQPMSLSNLYKTLDQKSSCFFRTAFPLLTSVPLVFCLWLLHWSEQGVKFCSGLRPLPKWLCSAYSSVVCEQLKWFLLVMCFTFRKSVCPVQMRLANFQICKLLKSSE